MSSQTYMTLQDRFLTTLIQDKTPVSIYLVTGVKLLGYIVKYDAYSIQISGEINEVVHKNAVATIIPTEPQAVIK